MNFFAEKFKPLAQKAEELKSKNAVALADQIRLLESKVRATRR